LIIVGLVTCDFGKDSPFLPSLIDDKMEAQG
jgi:hypothetical protein